MNTEQSQLQKIRRLPWAIANLSLNSVFAQLTFGGPLFILFLAQLGLPKTIIGLLLALFPFCGLVTLVVGPVVAHLGFKRAFITFYGLRNMVIASLIFTPWILTHYGQSLTLVFVVLVTLIFALLRAISETGYNSWFHDFVPNSVRERFSSVSTLSVNLAGALALCVAGLLLLQDASLDRYRLLIGIGVVFGVASLIASFFIPGSAPVRGNPVVIRIGEIIDVLQHRDFVYYLAGLALVTLGTAPLSFLPLLITEHLGLPFGTAVIFGTVTILGSLASSFLWGWAAKRWGNKPVAILGLCAISLMMVTWLLVPAYSPINLEVVAAASFLTGLTVTGWTVVSIRLLLHNIVPRSKKTDYLSIHYAWAGLAAGFGPLLTGLFMDLLKTGGLPLLGKSVDVYTPLFIAGCVVCLASTYCIAQVRVNDSITARKLAEMLLKGNLFRAAQSLIQYRRARAEADRVSVTEQLGLAGSPLTVDELLDALSDPSFNVRHEAIVAVSRMAPDDRLYNALVEILDGNEPDLAISAVWAMGRMGDRRAIGPLREALGSHYALIQARSARALATLGDYEITPILLDHLKSEPDDGLRLAYASALGSLRCKEAVPILLPFLKKTRGQDPRMELALALARIIGKSENFVLLARHARVDASLAFSKAIYDLKKDWLPIQSTNSLETTATLPERCAGAFEKSNREQGVQLLIDMIKQLPLDDLSLIHSEILRDAAMRLEEYGSARIEYTMIAIHTLAVALSMPIASIAR